MKYRNLLATVVLLATGCGVSGDEKIEARSVEETAQANSPASEKSTSGVLGAPSASAMPVANFAGWRDRVASQIAFAEENDPDLVTALTEMVPLTARRDRFQYLTGKYLHRPGATALLLRRLESTSDAATREAIVRALSRTPDFYADAISELISREENPAVRAVMVSSVAKVESEHARKVIRAGFLDGAETVRIEAAIAAGKSPHGDSLVDGLVIALDDPNVATRRVAVRSIAVIGAKQALPSVVALAADADPAVRREALRTAYRLDATIGASLARSAVSDSDPSVSQAAQNLLAPR